MCLGELLFSIGWCVAWGFFFFQAEDGIRDTSVTGVQTCALPIFAYYRDVAPCAGEHANVGGDVGAEIGDEPGDDHDRSEERRVGKECRARRAPYHQKKKKK